MQLFGDASRAVELMKGAPWDQREVVLFLPRASKAPFLPLSGDARAEFERIAAAELRRFIGGWLSADRSWEAWLQPNFQIFKAVNTALLQWTFVLGADRLKRPGHLDPYLQPAMSRATANQLAQSFAAWYFLPVLLHDDGPRVGKCDRCEQYFFSASLRGNKRFCSRSCNRVAGAMRATRSRRRAERAVKLEAAQRALARLPARRRSEWKKFVVGEALRHRVALTPHFLARAVSLGDLVAPQE